MACNSCAKTFNLLRPEKGCPGCGFSYCSKCLNNKIYLTKLSSEAKVCKKCEKSTNNVNESQNQIAPPDAYYKRLGALQDKANQQVADRLNKLKQTEQIAATGGNEEISERLQKLKGDIPTTSDAELQSRLANIKGVPLSTLQVKTTIPVNIARTEQKQVEDLMKQYMEQVNIDTNYTGEFQDSVDDIEKRLNKLRGTTNTTTTQNATSPVNKHESDDDDDEESVKKIIAKINAEINLHDSELQSPTNDELPFCEICNEDAKMRCLGCKYLFCKRCFLDHKDDDDGCDKYELYKPLVSN